MTNGAISMVVFGVIWLFLLHSSSILLLVSMNRQHIFPGFMNFRKHTLFILQNLSSFPLVCCFMIWIRSLIVVMVGLPLLEVSMLEIKYLFLQLQRICSKNMTGDWYLVWDALLMPLDFTQPAEQPCPSLDPMAFLYQKYLNFFQAFSLVVLEHVP